MAHTARRPDVSSVPTRYQGVVAYDGTRYQGFQRQAGDTPTIQGALEIALERVTQQQVTLKGAGRTDSGVHASGQVIAFDVMWRHDPPTLWRALNANLPGDIALQSLDEAPAGFHPRFDARSRMYKYTLYVAPVQQPLLAHQAWYVPTGNPLDMEAMQHTATCLIGEHDFAAFGQPPQGNNTVRDVMRSEFAIMPETLPRVTLTQYTIEANAFLYRMVRRIVGALVKVGCGTLSPDVVVAALHTANSSWSAQAAPAHGLCLTQVTY